LQLLGIITVHNNKQKDDEEFKTIHLRLKQVALDDGATSCVLEAAAVRSGAPEVLAAQFKTTLAALATSPDRTATTKEWATRANLKERTFHSHRKALVERGYVEEVKRGIYTITQAGQTAIGPAATARTLHIA
jgi:predicted transcriptional regulator